MDALILTLSSFSPGGKAALMSALHECLGRLTTAQKLAIQMRFWEELEIAQIAALLGTSWDYADHLLENTFIQLRDMIREHLSKDQIQRAA